MAAFTSFLPMAERSGEWSRMGISLNSRPMEIKSYTGAATGSAIFPILRLYRLARYISFLLRADLQRAFSRNTRTLGSQCGFPMASTCFFWLRKPRQGRLWMWPIGGLQTCATLAARLSGHTLSNSFARIRSLRRILHLSGLGIRSFSRDVWRKVPTCSEFILHRMTFKPKALRRD